MMKKLIIVMILTSVLYNCMAPNLPTPFLIPAAAGIESYEPLIRAVFRYESNGDSLAYNVLEGATGGLQIRQCRVDHWNELMNTNYKLKDFYNYQLSKEMYLYFTNHDGRGNLIPNKSYEQTAKDWNGSGPMTEVYWNNLKQMI